MDQALKVFVVEYMSLGQSIPLFGLLKLTYVRNTGAAFSLFSGYSPYLALLSLLIILVVIHFHYRVPEKSYFLQTGMAFILGGSLGNLMDRVYRSYVVDYIDVGFWPVFNLADVAINVGVLIVIIEIIILGRRDAPDTF
jgi:signal peptidase II